MKDRTEKVGTMKKCLGEAKEEWRRLDQVVTQLEIAFAKELQLVIRIF
jgi:hypothetical protein